MEGVGDVWIEKLADDGVLQSRADFYTLTAEQLMTYERMGEVSAKNMVDSIERSKGIGLRRALIGLAIPMASDGTAKRLCLAGYEDLEDVAAAGVPELVAIRDIGPKVAESVVAFFDRPEVLEEITALRAAGVDLDVHDEDRPLDVAAAADSPLKGKTVVITGAFTDPRSGAKVSRPEVTRMVEQAARDRRLVGLASTTTPAGGRRRRRGEDREGRQARRGDHPPGRAVGVAGRGGRGVRAYRAATPEAYIRRS